MTEQTQLRLLGEMRARILKTHPGSTPRKYGFKTAPSAHTAMAHLLWMIAEVEKMEPTEKSQRWIGFVQGVLWTFGFYSIDELRSLVSEAADPELLK